MSVKLLASVVLAGLIGLPTASAQNMAGQRVMDSRCPATFDYKNLCPSVALELGNINLARSADMSSCDKLDNCPKCLTGSDWDQKLKDLGLGVADRNGIRPWVLFRNWLSHEVTSTLAMILLREALGYDAYGKSGTNTGNIDLICCGAQEMMVDFQRWGEGGSLVRLPEEGFFTVQMVPTGYTGTGAFYMPGYTLKKFPLADAYNAYKYLPEYANIFPKAFSTNCSDMLLDKTPANIATCGAPGTKYVCSRNTWTNTQCTGGHYVPPQCEGDNAQYCQEIYHPDPGTDRGRFEGMIKNNKLNFTIAYVGNDGYGDFLKAKYARGEDFLFMWQLPDPLTSALAGRPINLDPNTAACEAVRNSDPTLNMAGCAYPTTTIQKAARRDVLRQHPDFKFFIDNFQISDDLIAALLVMHKEGSGNMTVHELTCHWLKNNFNVWSKWIQNTRADQRVQYRGEDGGVAAYVIAVPVVVTVAVVCVLAALVIFFTRKTVDNTFAPKTAPLALLFTDVERSTTLWEVCGADMKQAMDTHNTIIRRLIAEYQAYEVKTNGDSFMIACRSLTDATLLAVAIQTTLNEATYPQSINDTYETLHEADVSRNPRITQANGEAAFCPKNLSSHSPSLASPQQQQHHLQQYMMRRGSKEVHSISARGMGSPSLHVGTTESLVAAAGTAVHGNARDSESTGHQMRAESLGASQKAQGTSVRFYGESIIAKGRSLSISTSVRRLVPFAQTVSAPDKSNKKDSPRNTASNKALHVASPVSSTQVNVPNFHTNVQSFSSSHVIQHEPNVDSIHAKQGGGESSCCLVSPREAASLTAIGGSLPADNCRQHRRDRAVNGALTSPLGDAGAIGSCESKADPNTLSMSFSNNMMIGVGPPPKPTAAESLLPAAPATTHIISSKFAGPAAIHAHVGIEAAEVVESETVFVGFSSLTEAVPEGAGLKYPQIQKNEDDDKRAVVEFRPLGASGEQVSPAISELNVPTALKSRRGPYHHLTQPSSNTTSNTDEIRLSSSAQNTLVDNQKQKSSSIENRDHSKSDEKGSQGWNYVNSEATNLNNSGGVHQNVNADEGEKQANDIGEEEPWRGLRVRIALHWCTEVTPQLDPKTGRFDYLGHDVNVCARVEGYARGGEILVHEDTYLALQRSEEYFDLVSPDVTTRQVAREAELKGVNAKVALWSLQPVSLSARCFPPLKGVVLPITSSEEHRGALLRSGESSQLNIVGDLWSESVSSLKTLPLNDDIMSAAAASPSTHTAATNVYLERKPSMAHSVATRMSSQLGGPTNTEIRSSSGRLADSTLWSADHESSEVRTSGDSSTIKLLVRNEVTRAIRTSVLASSQALSSDSQRAAWLEAMGLRNNVSPSVLASTRRNIGRLTRIVQSAAAAHYINSRRKEAASIGASEK